MGRRKKIVQQCERLMDEPKNIRNIAIAAHVDHGKTTLTDNLLAETGMISDELAGHQLAMDT
ncbi:MAG: GTP-binding protein, partial [Halobacteriales archaeon]